MDKGWPDLKGCFPFRLGTTSYILPAPILPNVRFLAPLVDEIELVLFESRFAENLPTEAEIRELARLGDAYDLSYNVHLPTDLALGNPDAAVRRAAGETLWKFYDRTLPLAPTAYILHLEGQPAAGNGSPAMDRWRENCLSSLAALFDTGVDRRRLAVENLEAPFAAVAPIVAALELNVCLDAGHLLRQSLPMADLFTPYGNKTVMIHLHGIDGGCDHRSLKDVPEAAWSFLRGFLETYRGGVSVEVFSRDDLGDSLVRLAELC
ncbi:MAG TPA: cobamide remodeling phosphodiesterase CbiR [Syntrophales bacterium]|nr:cobamide remodeling phosphodiesterase CbiR [Syntrophales bacterium]